MQCLIFTHSIKKCRRKRLDIKFNCTQLIMCNLNSPRFLNTIIIVYLSISTIPLLNDNKNIINYLRALIGEQ